MAFDLLVDEAFDRLGEIEFIGGEESKSVAFCFGAAGPADAVDVVFSILRDPVVDDMRDAGDVDAAGGDIGGDENFVDAILESLEGFHAIRLADVGVHDGHFVVPSLFQKSGQIVGFLSGAGEDHDAVVIGLVEEGDEEFVALVHGDRVEVVGDGRGDFTSGDLDFDGILQAPFCEGLDRGGHGGGEEKGLPLAGRAEVDDLADVGEEAHVEHAINLVEDEGADVAEIEGAAGLKVEEASRGGDDDVGAFFECFDLGAVSDPTVEKGNLVAAVFPVVLECLGDLMGQFAGWFEDETDGSASRFVFGEGRESKCGRFSSSGLGGPDDIPAFEDQGNGLGLNGGWGGIAGLGDSLEDRLGKAQIRKQHGAR